MVDKEGMRKFMPKENSRTIIDTLVGNANTNSRRFVKSHLPLSMNNPKDVCISFYNHTRLLPTYGFTGNLEVSRLPVARHCSRIVLDYFLLV